MTIAVDLTLPNAKNHPYYSSCGGTIYFLAVEKYNWCRCVLNHLSEISNERILAPYIFMHKEGG